MAHFAGRREIGVKFPMRAASVDPKSTQRTPLTIAYPWGRRVYSLVFWGVFFQKIGQNGRPGRWEASQSTSFDETSQMVS